MSPVVQLFPSFSLTAEGTGCELVCGLQGKRRVIHLTFG